jgi:sporulation protein YabP
MYMSESDKSAERTKIKRASNIQIEQRKKITVSGVEEVVNLSETLLTLLTGAGALNVYGSGMHLSKYNADEGFLVVEGAIDAFKYVESERTGGFFKKVFK